MAEGVFIDAWLDYIYILYRVLGNQICNDQMMFEALSIIVDSTTSGYSFSIVIDEITRLVHDLWSNRFLLYVCVLLQPVTMAILNTPAAIVVSNYYIKLLVLYMYSTSMDTATKGVHA